MTFSVWLLSLSCRMLMFTHQVAGVSTLLLWLKKPSWVMKTPDFVYASGIQREGVCRCEPNQPRGAAPHVPGVRTEGQSRGVHEDEEGEPHSGMEETSSQEHSSHFLSPNLACHLCSPGQISSFPTCDPQCLSPPPGSSDGLHGSPSLIAALSPLCLCLRPIKTNPATPLWVRFSTV